MTVVSYGRRALTLALLGAIGLPAHATEYPHGIYVESDEAWMSAPGDSVSVRGSATGRVVTVAPRGSLDARRTAFDNRTAGGPAAYAYGLLAFDEANAAVSGSRISANGERSIGVHAQGASIVDLDDVAIHLPANDGIGLSARTGARIDARDVTLGIGGVGSKGLVARDANSRIVGERMALAHTGGRPAGQLAAHAVAVSDGATIDLRDSVLTTSAATVDVVSVSGAGSVFTARHSTIAAQGPGSAGLALSGGTIAIHGGTVRGAGHAVRAGSGTDASVRVSDNAHLEGRIENRDTPLHVAADASRIDGDIVSRSIGTLDVSLRDAFWRGRADSLANVTIAGGEWQPTGDSTVGSLSLRADARIAFDPGVPAATLRVGTFDNATGSGVVTLRSRLDAGGPLGRQLTDRLIVDGDAIGQTSLHIANMAGAGASTSPLTTTPRAADGISVVQVGGTATKASFRLAGDYVAVGPWQYRLVAYGPGSTDASQRQVIGTGDNHWDFRLQSQPVGANGVPLAGRASHRRPMLVPQVPAYLVLANALFGYGRTAVDALHPVDGTAPRDPSWHARAFGGHATYRSDLPFERYAVDYARSDSGLQIAGDLMAWSSGATVVRAGVALSAGASRIAPRAVDGVSRAKVAARGVAMTYGLATEGGWRVGATYGFHHYRIDVDTPLRGEVLGRFRANANEASLGTAFRWDASDHLAIEPATSLLWQRLRFVSGRDRDGLMVRPGSQERLTSRTGARATWRVARVGGNIAAWSPYLDARYVATHGSGGTVTVAHVPLATGKGGRAAEVAAGVSVQFRGALTAHVDVTSRTRLGRAGESAWSARAGIAYAF
ncbi:MAG: autotransporter outer membrane beta-barrel domain-containing protein [Luteibacter sp.]